MRHGEVYGIGDEAFGVSRGVQFASFRNIGAGGQGDFGAQNDALEMTGAIRIFLHDSLGSIDILHYDDAGFRA
jgi:hypothetical protein